MANCSIEGCEKPRRSLRAEWCAMHYHRWYRHGDPLKTSAAIRTGHGRRYRLVTPPVGHPIAMPCGRAWEHRMVLFDALGEGPHRCRWCPAAVSFSGEHGARLEVDHLDGFGDHNDLVNLVPSCGNCNKGRSSSVRHEALAAQGFWSHNDTIAALKSGGRRVYAG
jgi:hypothetical protein